MIEKRYHSVRLDKTRCKGCTNCLKRCPTEAIRVRGGRAHIIDERCIDCGACLRACEYHAKIAETTPLEDIKNFKVSVALPAPSLYGQFKELKHPGSAVAALRRLGFTEVFDVARGADVITRGIRELIRDKSLPRPLISSACPAVVRLIQVRFPDLIGNIVPLISPMEAAAAMARREAAHKHHLPESEIGIFFITPCAAKMTAIRSPIGHQESNVDGAIAISDVYGPMLPYVSEQAEESLATPMGLGWARSGGELTAISAKDRGMAVDGIENVSNVLEEIESGKLRGLDYFEGSACLNGCVGGPLTLENSYVARNIIRAAMATLKSHLACEEGGDIALTDEIRPNEVMRLDENMGEAMRKMERMNDILARLPGYDCGSCGSPTCRTFAEDIVRGYCVEMDCIHVLKQNLKDMAQKMVDLAQMKRE